MYDTLSERRYQMRETQIAFSTEFLKVSDALSPAFNRLQMAWGAGGWSRCGPVVPAPADEHEPGLRHAALCAEVEGLRGRGHAQGARLLVQLEALVVVVHFGADRLLSVLHLVPVAKV